MFKFTSNYILGAIVVIAYASIASAAPHSEFGARNNAPNPDLKICIDPNFEGPCITFSFLPGGCYGFTGTLSGYDKAVSSAQIPFYYSCTFYNDSACLDVVDSVTLGQGSYTDFSQLPGPKSDFNDMASSVSCILL